MKNFRITNGRVASGDDWVGLLIEVVWRSGRAVLDTALFCVLGVIVFSQLGTLAWLLGALTSLPTQQIPKLMPAVGWIAGLLLGLLRAIPLLRKPLAVPTEDATPGQPSPESDRRLIGLKPKAIRALRAGGVGAVLGLIAGFFLSLYLIVVCTAGILSPLAPRNWRDGFRMESVSQDRHDLPLRPQRDEGAGTGTQFWHPVFGSILKWTIPISVLAGCVFCVFAKDEDGSPSEGPHGDFLA